MIYLRAESSGVINKERKIKKKIKKIIKRVLTGAESDVILLCGLFCNPLSSTDYFASRGHKIGKENAR